MPPAQFGLGLQDRAHLLTIQHGHHHVKEDQVVLVTAQYFQRFKTMPCCTDSISFKIEYIDHHIANDRVIIDYQDVTRFVVVVLVHPAHPYLLQLQRALPCVVDKKRKPILPQGRSAATIICHPSLQCSGGR